MQNFLFGAKDMHAGKKGWKEGWQKLCFAQISEPFGSITDLVWSWSSAGLVFESLRRRVVIVEDLLIDDTTKSAAPPVREKPVKKAPNTLLRMLWTTLRS